MSRSISEKEQEQTLPTLTSPHTAGDSPLPNRGPLETRLRATRWTFFPVLVYLAPVSVSQASARLRSTPAERSRKATLCAILHGHVKRLTAAHREFSIFFEIPTGRK